MQTKREWVINFAKAGYVAKGIVYCLVGIWTALSALGFGGENMSKSAVFLKVKQLPGGMIMLAVLTVGLLAYSLWRLLQAIADTENKGNDAKGIGKRMAFALSGLIYGSIAFAAFKIGTGSSKGESDNSSQKTAMTELLDKPFGKWLAVAVGLIILGNGVYQLIRAYKGSFMKNVQGLPTAQYYILERAGRFGYTSRGIVFGIIGYLFVKAALHQNPSEVQGTTGAFGFLESSPFGSWLLAAVAIGLIGYGIFMFVRARYSRFSF